ncbi:monooxygenase [Hypoxylon sp. FL0543]|nr:monooxygenase [Hypoxylon sp. FL0543]
MNLVLELIMNILPSYLFYGFGLFSPGHASQVAIPGAILGVLFHATIPQVIDVDCFVYELLAVVPLVVVGFAAVCSLIGLSPFDIVIRLSVLITSFNAGLFSSMVIYRLFLHRLRRFPGPLDVKISRFFSSLRVAKDAQYYKKLARLHEEYGDFIRTGPREICIVRKSAVAVIYGPNSKCGKSTWYIHFQRDSKKSSLASTRDHDDHRKRRRAWDRGLSMKALNAYAPRIKALADTFVSQMSRQKGPVDATAWSNYLTFDIMGSAGFGKDFGCVASGEKHPAIQAIHDHMYILAVLSHVPWLLNLLGRLPGATEGYVPFWDYCQSQLRAKRANLNLEKDPEDIMSWLLKAVFEKDVSAPSTKEALEEDCRALIIAGSDTNASTLAQALFFLAKYPSVLIKLQEKIDAIMPTPADWTYEKARSITYIDNIIDETLRLKPAVLSGVYRVTPREGIQIDEQFIPGYTNVFVPTQRIQTDPRYWKQATEFIPERFGERRTEMDTDSGPYIPFCAGNYSCVGKNLAIMSLRIAISSIAQHFDISFAPGETGEEFDKGAKDTFTTTLLPLMLRFSPRK